MPLKERNRIHAIAAFFAMAIFSLYCFSIAPVVQGFDSAELTVGAYTLGFIHPPGYPLYLLLGYGFSHLPVGSVGLNLNFMSAILGGLSVFVLVEFLYYQTKNYSVSIISALLFAVNPYFWSQSVRAEVYTLHILLVTSVLFSWLYGTEKNNHKIITLGFILLGLSAANHTTTFLLWLSYFVFVLKRKPLLWLGVKASFLSLVIMLLFYTYFPIRMPEPLEVDYIRDYFDVKIDSFSGILWLVTGQAFRCAINPTPSITKFFYEVIRLWNYVWTALLGVGLIFSVLGFSENRKENLSWNRFLTFYFLLNVLFFLFYDVVDKEAIFLPIILIVVVWFAHGLVRAPVWMRQYTQKFTSQQIKLGISLSLSVFILIGVISDWHYVSLRYNDQTYQYALGVMENIAEDTVIVNHWVTASVFDYLRIVENKKQQTESFNLDFYFLGIQQGCTEPDEESKSEQQWFSWLEERVSHQNLCFIEPLPPTPENYKWSQQDPCWILEKH